jgi:uncharacterized membrane protein YhaH (DUF805 family)
LPKPKWLKGIPDPRRLRAAQTRLRPIIMTSLAFIAGVTAAGRRHRAGANSRVAIGTGIIGGTLTATLLAVFFVPLFFVLVKRLFTRNANRSQCFVFCFMLALLSAGCVSLTQLSAPGRAVPATCRAHGEATAVVASGSRW